MYERFDDKAAECVLIAQERAQKLGVPAVDTEHLLLALVALEGTIASHLLNSFGLTMELLESKISTKFSSTAEVRPSFDIPLSERAQASIGMAWASAVQSGERFIGPQDILIGLIDEGTGVAVDALKSIGIDLKELREQTIARATESQKAKKPNGSKSKIEDGDMSSEQYRQFREAFLVEIGNVLAYSLGLKDALQMVVNIIGKVMRTSRCLISIGTSFGGSRFEYWSAESGGSCEEIGWPKPESVLLEMSSRASQPIILLKEQFDLVDSNIAQELHILNVKSLLAIALLHQGKVRGWLMLHQCDDARTWAPEEIDWLQRIANFVAERLSKQPN